MLPFRRSTLWGLLLIGLAAGCIEPFDTRLNLKIDLITIDATLTDLPGPQIVRLRRSISTDRSSQSQPLRGATVEVLVNGQTRHLLAETNPGDYYLPADFVARPGSTYQLNFRTAQNVRYESTVETMPQSKPITRVYDSYDPEAVARRATGTTVFDPGHHIYIDTQDPAGGGDYYNWSWTFWEREHICATCIQGMYYTGQGCVKNPLLDPDVMYDYTCLDRCWTIFRSRLINIMSDTYSNGRPIQGREVAQIPLYTVGGALIEIRQQALTPGAFRYLKLLADQTQNTGSLADTPPAAIFGNVGNSTNTSDKVVGYFTVASVSQTRYWLSRQNTPINANPVGLLGGRKENLEPSSGPPLRPPQAPCSPTENRTPTQPLGWQG